MQHSTNVRKPRQYRPTWQTLRSEAERLAYDTGFWAGRVAMERQLRDDILRLLEMRGWRPDDRETALAVLCAAWDDVVARAIQAFAREVWRE